MSAPSIHVIVRLMANDVSLEEIQNYLDAWARPSPTVDKTVDTTVDKASRRTARWREKKRRHVYENVDKNVDKNVDTGGTIGGEDLSLENKKEKKKVSMGASVTQVTLRNGAVEEWTDKDIDDCFEEDVWPQFPKRQGANPKKPAKKKFKILVKSGANPLAIFDGAVRLASDCRRNGTEPQFIPQMITWLNQGRWEDGQEQNQFRR